MEITEEQQEELETLVEFGHKLEAVRYAQQEIGLDAEAAIALVEAVEAKFEAAKDKELEAAGNEVEKSTANLPGLLGKIFGGIGVILLLLGVYFGYRTNTFLETAVAVPGLVKEYRERQVKNTEDNTVNTYVSPVLEYHYNNKDYLFLSPYLTTMPEYAIGDQLPLLIDPNEPGKPDIDSFMNRWFVSILLCSIGLVFSGIGMIIVRAFRKF
jgi:Protein of unknown function (DUF3592)